MYDADLLDAKSVIFGCSGESLTDEEKAFFREANPLGFILFERNCVSPPQVRKLVRDLRNCVRHKEAPVLIDQEGGPVARLKPPEWPANPSAATIGGLVSSKFALARKAARLNGRLLGMMLADLGITVNCAPVMDVPVQGAHEVIGDRAFSRDPLIVSALGAAMCEGMLEAGVTPIIKHIPGHGRCKVDSHKELPIVRTEYERLSQTDFMPFSHVAGQEWGDAVWAMTAHVIFPEVDAKQPVTTSTRIVDWVIREDIHFEGPLISDDLSMEALEGSLSERAKAAIDAGMDIVLHCNGNLDEMKEIAAVVDPVGEKTAERLRRAEAFRIASRSEEEEDADRLRAHLDELIEKRAVA